MKRVQELAQPQPPDLTSSARRGPASQQPQRRRERFLRGHVVDFRHWAEELGWNRQQTAEVLHLSPRTLRQWEYDRDPLGALHLQWQPLGRPTQRSTPKVRNQVIAVLDEFGPALGVPWLRQAFPDLARAELEDILWRYRRVWRRRHYQPLRILHWQAPGSVWAADFADAPQPIDGIYPYLLAVRDLASAKQLLWLPVKHADGRAVEEALASLFALHGIPLVLKTDNGSPFAAALLAMLQDDPAEPFDSGLSPLASNLSPLAPRFSPLFQPLFSPPYTPAYNGSIEAGIGSLKTRTEAHAGRHGHPGFWTADDVAWAQAEANAGARPHGPCGPTPDELWEARRPIVTQERTVFNATVDRCRTELRTQPEAGPWPGTDPLTHNQARALDRQAIRRALEQHGYLLYSRRRTPLPINKGKVTDIA